MGLTRLSIERPLAILMLIVTLVLLGGVAYTKLRQDRFPAISFPTVSVAIQYPGASAADIEILVTRPIENALAGIAGVSSIRSTSRDGQANVNLELAEGSDVNGAAIEVERSLAAIRARFPDGVGSPIVRKADTSSTPVMNVALSGKRPLSELYDVAVNQIQPRLQGVAGVADVQVVGGLKREIQVRVDSSRLRAYGISLADVNDALDGESLTQPGGRLTDGGSSQAVRTVGLFESLDDLKRATVISGQKAVQLQDVAEVVDAYVEQTRLQRLNGQDAVGFIITKQADANGVQVSDDIRQVLGRARSVLPRDSQLQVTNDTAIFTRRSLDSVLGDLRLAVVLTAIVLLVFLHTWRPTAIVLLAIPTSLISTFLVIYIFGFSLNMISLMALALCIGILVDDSIVVLENIERHQRLGTPPREAALIGRSEIGLAAIAITLVDVVVYVPVSFMSGNLGRMFREFGLTIAVATLFSLLISFTLTPMLASRFLKPHAEDSRNPLAIFGRFWEAGYGRLAGAYRGLLGLSLGRVGRPLVVLIAAATLFASFQMLSSNLVGSEYVPQEDDGQFSIQITTPPGSSLQATDQVARGLEERLKKLPELRSMFTSVGSGSGNGAVNVRNASIAVDLKEKTERERSIPQILSDVRRWARDYPTSRIRAQVANPLASGGGNPLSVRLLGDDFETLRKITLQYEDAIRKVEGAVDINNDSAQRDPEVRAVVDRRRLSDLRVSAKTVAKAVRNAVDGSVVTQLKPEGADQVDVRVLASEADRASLRTLGAMPILASGGALVRLDQVATLVQDLGPAEIQRVDRQAQTSVTGNVSGRPIGDLARDVRAATAAIPLPEGYRVVFAGQVQQQEVAFAALLGTLVLSVVLVYILMVALYESFLTPLAILFSVPVSLVGAILGLYLTQNTFNIFSLIGCIMLMGLVGKNAILLIDFANTLRARGMARREALLEAGFTRLRPILMTTATVVIAMVPLAMKLEAGGESRAPMAVVIIGGVVSSTLLSLVLVPVMYTLLEDGQRAVGRAIAWRPAFARPRLRRPAAVAEPQVATAGVAPAERPEG